MHRFGPYLQEAWGSGAAFGRLHSTGNAQQTRLSTYVMLRWGLGWQEVQLCWLPYQIRQNTLEALIGPQSLPAPNALTHPMIFAQALSKSEYLTGRALL